MMMNSLLGKAIATYFFTGKFSLVIVLLLPTLYKAIHNAIIDYKNKMNHYYENICN